MSYHLRLIKALSYSGIITATKKKPDVYVTDKKIADAAVATGYFMLVGGEEKPPAKPEPKDPDYEALSKLNKTELEKYAKSHDIDISGCKTKADILQAISVANGGSYTMMELQEA